MSDYWGGFDFGATEDSAGATPDFSMDVGPQTDGTFNIPITAGSIIPTDAGGGPPAEYEGSVLDLFKYGVGVWQQDKQQNALYDYKRFEATNNGLWQQGQAALFSRTANGGLSPTLLLFGGGILLLALLLRK